MASPREEKGEEEVRRGDSRFRASNLVTGRASADSGLRSGAWSSGHILCRSALAIGGWEDELHSFGNLRGKALPSKGEKAPPCKPARDTRRGVDGPNALRLGRPLVCPGKAARVRESKTGLAFSQSSTRRTQSKSTHEETGVLRV